MSQSNTLSVPGRVGIISDDRIFSKGIQGIISADRTLACIPLSGHSPVPAVAIRAAALSVVLIDAGSRGGRELCETLTHDGDPPIMYLALRDDERWAVDALVAGARGVLLKSAPPEDLTKAIHVVLNGGVWAPHQILVAAWLNQTQQRSKRGRVLPIVASRLTPREMEILRHAATGLGNRELAFTLAISEATVKAHLTSIFQKLGVRGRARLAAAYHGIVSVAPTHLDAKRVPLPAAIGRTTFDGVVRRSAN